MRGLESPPHLFPPALRDDSVTRFLLLELVVHQSLRVFPFPVSVVFVAAVADDVRHDSEEGQLLVVLRQALVLRVVQLARSIVVENVPEDFWVSIEKVFFGILKFIRTQVNTITGGFFFVPAFLKLFSDCLFFVTEQKF